MGAVDVNALREGVLARLDRKPISRLEKRLPALVEALCRYDLHFMRLTGVLDENDEWGEAEYDEDEAFEYVYDAYLSDNPGDADEDMAVASLLNQYMELKDNLL